MCIYPQNLISLISYKNFMITVCEKIKVIKINSVWYNTKQAFLTWLHSVVSMHFVLLKVVNQVSTINFVFKTIFIIVYWLTKLNIKMILIKCFAIFFSIRMALTNVSIGSFVNDSQYCFSDLFPLDEEWRFV